MKKAYRSRIFAKMWLLGDRWEDQRLKNTVMVALCDIEFTPDEKLSANTIPFILDTTTMDSPLRCWLIEHIIGINHATLCSLRDSLSKDVLYGALQKANELVQKGCNALQSSRVSRSTDKCKFHERKEREAKCVDDPDFEGELMIQTGERVAVVP